MDCVTRDGSFCARSFSAFFGKSKKEPTRFEKLWKEGTKKIISEHRVEKFKENMKKESIETMQQMQRESASRASSKSLDASSSESAGRISQIWFISPICQKTARSRPKPTTWQHAPKENW
eukprot:GEMP01082658.1.p1 GENE.GEMP01082658.1~~GEMP01082658.1.p1  ORF type:complete len:120 (+),score=18.11 GEMP01082658.1:106-465(+)